MSYDDAYDFDDPKHPDYHDTMSDVHDLREREIVEQADRDDDFADAEETRERVEPEDRDA